MDTAAVAVVVLSVVVTAVPLLGVGTAVTTTVPPSASVSLAVASVTTAVPTAVMAASSTGAGAVLVPWAWHAGVAAINNATTTSASNDRKTQSRGPVAGRKLPRFVSNSKRDNHVPLLGCAPRCRSAQATCVIHSHSTAGTYS